MSQQIVLSSDTFHFSGTTSRKKTILMENIMSKKNKTPDAAAVARVQKSTCKKTGGTTPPNSHASRMQKAHDKKK